MRILMILLTITVGLWPCFAPAALASQDQAILDKAVVAFSEKDYRKSVNLLLPLESRNPNNTLILFNLGNALFMQGRHNAAIKRYQKVIELKSPLMPAAQFYSAKAMLQLGRTKEARDILQSLSNQNLPSALRAQIASELNQLNDSDSRAEPLELALTHYRAGEYHKALEMLPATNADLGVEGRLLRSMVLIHLNRVQEARRDLRQIARTAPGSMNRRTARDLLAAIEDRGFINEDAWLFVEGAFGYHSNPLYEPTSNDPTGRATARFSIGGGYRHFLMPSLSIRPGYTFSFDHAFEESEVRETVHSVSVPLEIEQRRWTFSLGPVANARNWDGDPALLRTGVHGFFEFHPEYYSIGAESEITAQKNLDADLSYLKGETKRARIFAGVSLFPFYVQTTYTFAYDRIGNLIYADGLLPLANHAQGPGGKLIWRMHANWSAVLHIDSLTRKYSIASQPTGKSREDKQLALDLRIVWRAATGLAFFLEAESLSNTSTLGASDISDKNYRAHSASVGLSYDLL